MLTPLETAVIEVNKIFATFPQVLNPDTEHLFRDDKIFNSEVNRAVSMLQRAQALTGADRIALLDGDSGGCC